LTGISFDLFASDVIPIDDFLAHFRNRGLLWGPLLDLSLYILQCPLYFSYHFPPSVADFFIPIALYCVEPLEEAVQGLLVGAHWRVVLGDRKLGVIKVKDSWELERRLEHRKPTAHGTDGSQR
jgi:hypothetical protein